MKKIILLLSLFLSFLSSGEAFGQSYDVEQDGVYFTILGSHWAHVTCWGFDMSGPGQYSGTVLIPEQISYKGRTYKVISVSDNAFAGCEALTRVQLPSSLQAISPCAFIGCTNLREVTVPSDSKLKDISPCVFTGCTSLQNIVLPRRTEFVDSLTYYCCASLTSFVLPHRVRAVCWGAFGHLPSVEDIYCYASVPPMAEQGAFTLRDQQRCTLHVPRETLRLYQASPVWSDFSRIVALTDEEYLQQGYRRGDINDDGKVNAEDLALLQRIVVSLPDDSAVRWAADINGDGKVNAEDYVLLAKRL